MKLLLAKQFAHTVALTPCVSMKVKLDVIDLVTALCTNEHSRDMQIKLNEYIRANNLTHHWPQTPAKKERVCSPAYTVTSILPSWQILTSDDTPQLCCLHIMSHSKSYNGTTHRYVMENIIVIGAHTHEAICIPMGAQALLLAIKQSIFQSVPLVYINRHSDILRIKRLEVRFASERNETSTHAVASGNNGSTCEWKLQPTAEPTADQPTAEGRLS